jgi:serine protease
MSVASNGSTRIHALAAATMLALSIGPAFAGGADLSGLQTAEEFDQFIVKYKDGSSAKRDAAALNLGLRNAASKVAAARGHAFGVSHKRKMSLGMDVIRADRKLSRADAEALMRQIAADPNVQHVEVDVLQRALVTPNDPMYNGATDKQWHYFNSAVGAKLPAAWDQSTGNGIVVAVVDSGILAHSDLDANVLPGYDMITSTTTGNGGSGDGNGRDNNPNDSSNIQHGTHVAGTIAAVTNNSVGVAGVAYNAKIVPIRALGNGGYGSTSDIVDGIVWASGGSVTGVPANANPAEVINLSLGGQQSCTSSSAYQTAINTAVANGSIVVVAAGNSNMDVANFSPASCANTVTVAASDINGNRAWYSNYGNGIDITAPGGETCSPNVEFLALGESTVGKCTQNHTTKGVLSTVANNGYAYYQGTSMAAPHVAGIVALIQAKASTPKTTAEINTLLSNTARTIAAANCPGGCGPGLVDTDEALKAVGGGGGAPVANFSFSASGLTVNFTDASTDSDGTIASRSWNFGDGTTSTATSPSKTYASAGSYTVTLTVTDNSGLTNTKTQTVTVTDTSGNVLTNGVAKTGLAGAAGSSQTFTLAVPSGASSLKFVSSGGTGDADMYVKFGSAPTTTTYDCKSEGSTNAETCNITTAQAGTYYVLIKGYSAFSGMSLTGSYTTGPITQTYTNTTDYTIGDNTTVESPITVSGRSGNGLSSTQVAVNIVHTYIGDLKVDLVAPDGSVYTLHNHTGSSTDNINQTYTVNLSGEALNGTWKLRVNDNAGGDTGYINSWSVTF